MQYAKWDITSYVVEIRCEKCNRKLIWNGKDWVAYQEGEDGNWFERCPILATPEDRLMQHEPDEVPQLSLFLLLPAGMQPNH